MIFLRLDMWFLGICWVCALYLTRFLRDRTSPTQKFQIRQLCKLFLSDLRFRVEEMSDLKKIWTTDKKRLYYGQKSEK